MWNTLGLILEITLVFCHHKTCLRMCCEDWKNKGQILAKELSVKGLMNILFAVKDDEIFLIEVNPRAYRTVPFFSKPIGHPLGKYTTWLMLE